MLASTTPARRSLRAAALTVAAALAVSACSGGEPAPPDGPTTAVEQGATPEGTPAADETSAASDPEESKSAAEAGIDPATIGDPYATFEIGAGGLNDPDATLQIGVYPLQRDGKVVTLVARVTLDAPPEESAGLRVLFGGDAVRPVLVDTTNLRSHSVANAGSKQLTTDTLITRMSGGQTRYWHAVYAAPPEDITTMTVLFDGVPAITEVPIQ